MPSWFMFAAGNAPLIFVGPLDIVIIAIYFVVVLGIGFYSKKYVSTGEDFFMAGRKMTAWIAGLSFISANLSSLETMGWSAMAYQYGMLGAHAYLIGAIPAILFLAIVMMPFYYICKTHSVPGYLKLRYGTSSSALAGISFAILTVLVSGASMFAMAKILHLLLGWNMNVSIWAASLTVAVYVTLGGLISAVFNEVLQYFLIWFGSLLIPILGLIDAGGWNGMLEKIRHNVPVIHPSVGNANFTSLWRNLGSFDTNPMGIDWFGMVFGLGLAVSFGYWCTDFLQVQRVIVAKDLRAAQNGTIIGAVLKMLVPIIVTIPGLLGLAVLLNTDGSPLVLVPESDPRANITHHTFNDVLPLLMGKYLGPGLLGLGVTAMIAGFMSGMAGNVSAFATVWTYDVYRTLFNRNASDSHYLKMGRWCSLLGVLMSIGTAYALFYFSNILEFLQVLIFFFIVPLFGVVIVGMLWKKATPTGAFVGFLTAILVSMSMWAYVHTFPEGYRPKPRAVLAPGAAVRLEKTPGGGEAISRVIVEKGTVQTTKYSDPRRRQAGGHGCAGDSRAGDHPAAARGATGNERRLRAAGSGCGPCRLEPAGQVRGRGSACRPPAGGQGGGGRGRADLQPRRIQPGAHEVHCAIREGQADGRQHVQRFLDAHRLCVGPDRRESVHRAEARERVAQPGHGPDTAAGRRAGPLV
jgi:solute:Na+ symporter, SSS family